MHTQYTPQTQWGLRGGGGRDVLATRSLCAGKDSRKVVVCPRWGSDPASGHPWPKSHCWGFPPLVWGVHLDARCQRRGQWPSSTWSAVNHRQCGGSLGITYQEKGLVNREIRMGQVGRETQVGERRWALPHLKGKGSREGQGQVATSQWSPSAANNLTTKCHADPLPPLFKAPLCHQCICA